MSTISIDTISSGSIHSVNKEEIGSIKADEIIKSSKNDSMFSDDCSNTISADDSFIPILTLPKNSINPTFLGKFTLLTGNIANGLNDMSHLDFNLRLETIKMEQKNREIAIESNMHEIEDEMIRYQANLSQLSCLIDENNKSLNEYKRTKEKLDNVNQCLIATLPQDPKYYELKLQADKLSTELQTTWDNIANQQERLSTLTTLAINFESSIDSKLAKVEDISNQLLLNVQYISQIQKKSDNTKLLIYLVTCLQEILQKSNEYNILSCNELSNAISKTNQENMLRKANEYDKNINNANKVSSIFGWILKSLGLVLSAITVAVTGGISMIIATAAIVVTSIDIIYELIKGESFINTAIEELIGSTLSPLIDELAKDIREQLVKHMNDVAASVLSQTIAILSVISSAAVIVIGLTYGGSALSGLLGPKISALVAKNMALNSISNGMKNIVEVADKISQRIFELLSKFPIEVVKNIPKENMMLIMHKVIMAGLFTQAIAAGSNGGAMAYFSFTTSRLGAEVGLLENEAEYSLNMLNKAAAERLSENNDMIFTLQKSLISIIKRSNDASIKVYKNISFKA